MPQNDEDFAALLEQHGSIGHVRLAPGDKVEARVIHITKDTVFCELSQSQEGFLPLEEVLDEDRNPTVAVGDRIEVYVVRMGDSIELGRRIGRGGFDLDTLQSAKEGGMPIEGTVTGVNKGGLEVSVGGTRGFCPMGQVDIDFVEDPNTFVGRSLQFVIKEVKENGRNVVLSRRVLLERERNAAAQKLLVELAEGQRRTGTVARIADFGIFVDLGGIDGLVPISELGHQRVENPADVVSVGDTIEVEIVRIEDDPKRPGKKRLSLSMKATMPDPFDGFAARAHEGLEVEGKVARLDTFGAFVEVAPGVQGLVHISQLADRRINHPREVVEVGQQITVRVLGVDTEKKRISLSLRDAGRGEAVGATGAAGEVQIGTNVTGTVDRIERYGVFVVLQGGGRALLPAAETGTQRGADLGKAFPIGTEVLVRVIAIDEQGRIKVSKTAVEEAEERAVVDAYGRDSRQASGKGFGTLGDLMASKAKKR